MPVHSPLVFPSVIPAALAGGISYSDRWVPLTPRIAISSRNVPSPATSSNDIRRVLADRFFRRTSLQQLRQVLEKAERGSTMHIRLRALSASGRLHVRESDHGGLLQFALQFGNQAERTLRIFRSRMINDGFSSPFSDALEEILFGLHELTFTFSLRAVS